MTIKVALVGLSARAATSWAANAHLPYLLSDRGRARFQIVALLNSSADAARAARAHYQLGEDVRAYGDPAALAADMASGAIDVDLVSVATRVDVHYAVVRPLLAALGPAAPARPGGVGVLVEWPLAANPQEAHALAGLVGPATGIRSAVGLQGRLAPFYLAVRSLIASGRLGRILSSEARAYGGSASRSALREDLAYFLDRSVGGNIITISLGHLIDSIQFALGELRDTKTQSQLQRPRVDLRRRGADGAWTVVRTAPSDVPDLMTVLGTLAPRPDGPGSAYFSDGSATLQVRFRRGEPFPGEPAYVWTVAGEKGELRLVCASGPAMHALGDGDGDGADDNDNSHNAGPTAVRLTLHDYATDTVAAVPWRWQDWQRAQAVVPARNVGALYEAYAAGREAAYATFADAAARHEQLEGWLDAAA